MISLNLQHRTRYRYRKPVNLGQHRLMLRPRESRDVRLISYDLVIAPQAALTWAYDVFGNAVGSATFLDQTDELVITSTATLELAAVPWPIFDIAAYAISYPFRYSDEEWIDLGPLVNQHYQDPNGQLRNWARGFIASERTDTLSLLKDLSAGVSQWLSYASREDEGTQSPNETLERRIGSCRDYAVLFAERPHGAWALGLGLCLVTFGQGTLFLAHKAPVLLTLGQRSMFQGRAGLPSIQRTAQLAAST